MRRRRGGLFFWLPPVLQFPAKILTHLCLWGCFFGLCIAAYYMTLANKYDMESVCRLPARSVIYDRDGRELLDLNKSGRRLVTRDEIPDFLVWSLLAREDATFFEHGGIDVKGLARATLRNLKDGEFTQGASTLSMQLTKNAFENRAKTIHRKILEIFLTLRLEKRYTKDEILTNYLNRIYFGSGAYGIDAAAHTYFGKDVKDLNESQCATVVGIIRGPHIYSPLRNLEAACSQRNQVLRRLVTMGKIQEPDIERIKNIDLGVVKNEKKEAEIDTNYAIQAVRRHLDEITTSSEIKSGGLQIRATIDLELQARLDERIDAILQAFADYNYAENPLQVAAITMESQTGEILALCGGTNFSQSQYNRALDSKRNLGMAFEPILLTAAAERGKLPMISKPVQTGRQAGESNVIRIANRCGIDGAFAEGDDLFRGAVEATPLQWATAMNALFAKGNHARTYFIDSIKLSNGEVMFQNTPTITPIVDADSTREARKLLGSNQQRKFFVQLAPNRYDLWAFCGVGTRTIAFWMGYDQNEKLPEDSEKRLLNVLNSFRFDK